MLNYRNSTYFNMPPLDYITCTLCTTLLVSSNNDIAVDVENDVAPLCRPRTMRPSFLYCSTGSQNKSFIPCATEERYSKY